MYKNFVSPRVYFIGATALNMVALRDYLQDTGQEEFIEDIKEAEAQGLSGGEILCSFYAKLCYASLTDKKNKNITKIRSIYNNLLGVIESGHGSVIEHCNLNFVVTDCSRVFTHEMVRHRVGTAYSQTSGRYVRTDELNMIIDPILEPWYRNVEEIRQLIETFYKILEQNVMVGVTDMNEKKRRTSALRRILPNGQANEIGITLNLRTLRQTIEARTSAHAEWEIRFIFNQIYELVKKKYPTMFIDAHTQTIRGLLQINFENKKI